MRVPGPRAGEGHASHPSAISNGRHCQMLGRKQKEQDFPQTVETGKGSDEQDIEGSRKRQSALVPAHLQGGVVERQDGVSHVQMSSTRAAGRAHASREAQAGQGLGRLRQPPLSGPPDTCRVDLCG